MLQPFRKLLVRGPSCSSSCFNADLDHLEDIFTYPPVDLSEWLEPPTLQSRVPSMRDTDNDAAVAPSLSPYENLRISFIQQVRPAGARCRILLARGRGVSKMDPRAPK